MGSVESALGGTKRTGGSSGAEHPLSYGILLAAPRPTLRVDIRGHTVGYLSRAGARHYRKALAKLGVRPVTASCQARIRGGWDRGEDDQGFYGVYLDIPKV